MKREEVVAVEKEGEARKKGGGGEETASAFINFQVISAAYCTLTFTDGGLRTMILLNVAELGFTPIQIALMFTLYELLGVVVNLFGGSLATRIGLKGSCLLGLLLQVVSLSLAAIAGELFDTTTQRGSYLAYITCVQALAGAAKDLLKISGKSVTKLVVKSKRKDEEGTKLFRLVAYITGAKNSIKGLGMFLGGVILWGIGYWQGLTMFAVMNILPTPFVYLYVDNSLGVSKKHIPLRKVCQTTRSVGQLSLARFWLYGSRDVWFEIAAPVFLKRGMGLPHGLVSFMMGGYTIVYGKLQALSNVLCTRTPTPRSVSPWTAVLGILTAGSGVAFFLGHGNEPSNFDERRWWAIAIICCVFYVAFAVVMAVVSAVHSFLIVAYAGRDKVAKDVGFYYMANAGGRLVGTLLSGIVYEYTGDEWGISVCLWLSAGFLLIACVTSITLPPLPGASEGGNGEGKNPPFAEETKDISLVVSRTRN